VVKYTSIFIFFLYTVCLQAQEPIRYTTKDGLPSNNIYDIQQNVDGFMWFATNRGVVKYDGVTFKTFTLKDGLPNNDTWSLESDLEGRVWFFSKSNYQGFIKNDSVHKIIIPDSIVVSPAVIIKEKERIYFYAGNGIYLLTPDKIKNVAPPQYSSIYNKLTDKFNLNNFSDAHLALPNEKGYVIIKNNNLLFIDNDFKLLKRVETTTPTYNINKSSYKKIGVTYNDIIFYVTHDGFIFINSKTYKTKYYSFNNLKSDRTIEGVRVQSLENEIQINFEDHLLRFNYNLDLIEDPIIIKDLPNTNIFKDRDGNLWLIDLGQGITFIPNSQLAANYYLSGKKVQKINTLNNTLYAGVKSDGFYTFNNDDNNFKKVDFLKLTTNNYKIEEDTINDLGFLVSDGSLYILKNNEFTLPNFKIILNNKIDYSNQKDVCFFNDYLYSVSSGYFSKIDLKKNIGEHILNKIGLLKVTSFKDTLFVGGSDGLYILSNNNLIKPNFNNEVANTSIISFLSSDSHLFVGTDGRGVFTYSNGKIQHITSTEDLSVQTIIKKNHILWLATQVGIKKVFLFDNDISASPIVDSFNEADGLLQDNTNDIFVKDSLLYAASDNGISRINLNNDIYKKYPKVVFNHPNDRITYHYAEKDNISVSFSVIDYVNQKHITYQYRLTPSTGDDEWISIKTNTVNFSNLRPKTYLLQVRATNQHNVHYENNIFIEVIPAWWQTIWAKVVYVLLLIGGLLILFKITKKRIKISEEKKANHDKRVAGLELQALRSQMNPHFVHNSLNAIQYYIQRNEVELSENYLSKFSKLIRLFFEYSRKQNISIKDEVALLTNYLEIEKLRFEEKLDFNITVDDKIDIEEQILPCMILQPIVENAVNHGLFHKKEKGIVIIKFIYINPSSFKVVIEDDGIGIDKAKEIYSNSSKNYQSRSTAVLNERLELLKQSKNWNISYSITDKSKINNSTGTKVELVFNQF